MATNNIYRWSQFNQVYNKIMENSLPMIANKISETLKYYLKTNWYMGHQPQYYQRTYEVLNSITIGKVNKKGKNQWDILIYFDSNKINSELSDFAIPDGFIRLNHHMSVNGETMYGGASIGSWVVYWMNYGQNSKIYGYVGTHFLEDTVKFTRRDKTHIKAMDNLLRSMGL